MSDPVSNADIEDVLSSIRRLVSDEPSGGKGRRKAREDAQAERLILTPAFRVTERQDAEPEPEADETTAEAQDDEAPFVAAPEDDHQDSSQDAAAEIARFPTPELQVSEEYQEDSEWSAAQTDETDHSPEPVSEPVSVVASEPHKPMADLSLEERIAELEAAIEQAPQEWEPDGSEDGTSDETRPLSFDAGAGSDDVAEVITTEADGASQTADDADTRLSESELAEAAAPETYDNAETDVSDAPQDDSDDRPESNASAEKAEFETVRAGKISPVSEPETLGAVAPDDQPAEWQDAEAEPGPATNLAEPQPSALSPETAAAWEAPPPEDMAEPIEAQAEQTAQPVAEAGATTESDQGAKAEAGDVEEVGNLLADDEGVLDEEALREMVSDLVRQELQGMLGERITRNVRRLVRREIQRAMAMRDLE